MAAICCLEFVFGSGTAAGIRDVTVFMTFLIDGEIFSRCIVGFRSELLTPV
jgi:hypothetical protein